MNRSLKDAALGAALALAAGADAAEALAGQARGNLAVTVRVVDRCRTTAAGRSVAQDCTARAPTLVREEPPRAQALAVVPATAAVAGFLTVIY